MAEDEEVQEFFRLSQEYLRASKSSLDSDLIEPAMFNAIARQASGELFVENDVSFSTLYMLLNSL